jgi:hypothetical protein
MTASTTVWLYLGASAILAAWVIMRFPSWRPRSLRWAFMLFLAGQVVPSLGLVALERILLLHDGVQLGLPLVILPTFFVLWLTVGWLFWAIVDQFGEPRSGQPRRKPAAR